MSEVKLQVTAFQNEQVDDRVYVNPYTFETTYHFPRAKDGSSLVEYVDTIHKEISPPTKDCPEPNLWTMDDPASVETEVRELLYALVRATKPRIILETGTHRGLTANLMAKACEENGRGVVITCDPVKLWQEELHPRVQYHQASSLDLMISQPIDLLFSDSEDSIRPKEVERFSALMHPRSLVVIHDTGGMHEELGRRVLSLVDSGLIAGVFLPTPRGLFVGRLQTSHWR